MAAPEVPQPGVINPGYMQPTHYSPGQMANIPWITPLKGIGEQIMQAGRDIQQSPLNPAVRAQMQQDVVESQYNRDQMNKAMNDPAIMAYQAGFHGRLGGTILPGGNVPWSMGTQGYYSNKERQTYGETPPRAQPVLDANGNLIIGQPSTQTQPPPQPTQPNQPQVPNKPQTETKPPQQQNLPPNTLEGSTGLVAPPTPKSNYDAKSANDDPDYWLALENNALNQNPNADQNKMPADHSGSWDNGYLHYKTKDGFDRVLGPSDLEQLEKGKSTEAPIGQNRPFSNSHNEKLASNQLNRGATVGGPPGPADNISPVQPIPASYSQNNTSNPGSLDGGPPGPGDIGAGAGGSAITPPQAIASPDTNQQFNQPPPIQHPIVSAQTVKETLSHWDTNLAKANVAYVPMSPQGPGYRITTTGSKNGGGNTTFLPLTTYMRASGGAGGSDNIGMVMHLAGQQSAQENAQRGATAAGPTSPALVPPSDGGGNYPGGPPAAPGGPTIDPRSPEAIAAQFQGGANPPQNSQTNDNVINPQNPGGIYHISNPDIQAEQVADQKLKELMPNAPNSEQILNDAHANQVNRTDKRPGYEGPTLNGNKTWWQANNYGNDAEHSSSYFKSLIDDHGNVYIAEPGSTPGTHTYHMIGSSDVIRDVQDNDTSQINELLAAGKGIWTYKDIQNMSPEERWQKIMWNFHMRGQNQFDIPMIKQNQAGLNLLQDGTRYSQLLDKSPESWRNIPGQIQTLATKYGIGNLQDFMGQWFKDPTSLTSLIQKNRDANVSPEQKQLDLEKAQRLTDFSVLRNRLIQDAKESGGDWVDKLRQLGFSEFHSDAFGGIDIGGTWSGGKTSSYEVKSGVKNLARQFAQDMDNYRTGGYFVYPDFTLAQEQIEKNGVPNMPKDYWKEPANYSNRPDTLETKPADDSKAVNQWWQQSGPGKMWNDVTRGLPSDQDIGRGIVQKSHEFTGAVNQRLQNLAEGAVEPIIGPNRDVYSGGPANLENPPNPNPPRPSGLPPGSVPPPDLTYSHGTVMPPHPETYSGGPNIPQNQPRLRSQSPYGPEGNQTPSNVPLRRKMGESDVPPGQGHHPDAAWYPGKLTNAQFAQMNVPRGTWIESPPGHVWQVT